MNNPKKTYAVIKTFFYKGNFYLYDTYSNRLLMITKEHFAEIERMQKCGMEDYLAEESKSSVHRDITWLINKGVINGPAVERIEHLETPFVSFMTNRCLSDLILQVTKACNFKCRYCLYASDTSIERNHEAVNMEWEIAKRAIDYLYVHSVDSNKVRISFYGGEPLLNFSLIERAVLYARTLFQVKPVSFSMTINGALLNDNTIKFLAQHKFNLTISLDGPKDIQDYHRKFLGNGNGTFDVVYNNVLHLKNDYASYFKECVSFNPVLLDGESITYASKLFESLDVPVKNVFFQYANLQGIDFYKRQQTVTEEPSAALSLYEEGHTQPLLTAFQNKASIPRIWHHAGPCIPAMKSLFVDTDGGFYPCEKIIENPVFSIGSLDDGISIEKVIAFINIGSLTQDYCRTCWAMRFCSLCVSQCLDIDKNEMSCSSKRVSCKGQEKIALNFLKKFIDERVENE